jgi:hypothetical protein
MALGGLQVASDERPEIQYSKRRSPERGFSHF